MASINFLFRSKRDKSTLTLRLLFRYLENDYQIGVKTQISVDKDFWNKSFKSKRLKDALLLKEQKRIQDEIYQLESHVLESFNSFNTSLVNKQWLSNIINDYYNPKQEKILPVDLVNYFDYIEQGK